MIQKLYAKLLPIRTLRIDLPNPFVMYREWTEREIVKMFDLMLYWYNSEYR